MLKHYLISALRDLARYKATSVISIIGLAVGLGCFVAALGGLTSLTASEMQFVNADRIVAITEEMHPRIQKMDFASVRSSPPVARHLRVDFPELEAVATARDVLHIPVQADGRLGYLQAAAVEVEFLKIFDFSYVARSADNPLTIARGVVITEETAQKLFGTADALGKTITLKNIFDVTVTGVMRAVPQPSHMGANADHLLRFDLLLTEETHWQFRRTEDPSLPDAPPFEGDWWGSPVCFTYALLPADGRLSARELNARLTAFTQRHAGVSRNVRLNFKHVAIPISDLALKALDVELFKGNGLSLAPLMLALAAMVLGVALINFTNLAAARALTRARELGLRRVLGAKFPANTLRGSVMSRGSGVAPRALIGVQFAAAGILLIGLMVMNAQNSGVRAQALRRNADPIVVLEFPGRDESIPGDVLKRTLLQSGAIKEVSGIIRTPWSTNQASITGVSTSIGGTLRNALVEFVRYDFERALDIKVLAGRTFNLQFNDRSWPATRDTIADIYPIVVDRTTAQRLGFSSPADAVNRDVYWPLFSSGQLSGAHATLRIIGVIEDSPLRFDVGPGGELQLYALVPNAPGSFLVRVDKARVQEGLAAIDAIWKQFAPYAPVQVDSWKNYSSANIACWIVLTRFCLP